MTQIFLDAHSEANYNWIPPLVEPIALDYRTVVCPFVDVVDCDTYEYKAQDEGARGSFDWEFHYKRLPRVCWDFFGIVIDLFV
jgi:polypeptide N-acetylgalactosaminyltransferase